jgi:hypothetical protein
MSERHPHAATTSSGIVLATQIKHRAARRAWSWAPALALQARVLTLLAALTGAAQARATSTELLRRAREA